MFRRRNEIQTFVQKIDLDFRETVNWQINYTVPILGDQGYISLVID